MRFERTTGDGADEDIRIDPATGRYPPNPGEDGGRLDFPGDGRGNPLNLPPWPPPSTEDGEE